MSTSSIASATSADSTEAQASEENPLAVDVADFPQNDQNVDFLEIRHLLDVTQPYPAVMYPIDIHNGNHFVARGSLAIPPAMLADLAVVNRRNPNRLATLLGSAWDARFMLRDFPAAVPIWEQRLLRNEIQSSQTDFQWMPRVLARESIIARSASWSPAPRPRLVMNRGRRTSI